MVTLYITFLYITFRAIFLNWINWFLFLKRRYYLMPKVPFGGTFSEMFSFCFVFHNNWFYSDSITIWSIQTIIVQYCLLFLIVLPQAEEQYSVISTRQLAQPTYEVPPAVQVNLQTAVYNIYNSSGQHINSCLQCIQLFIIHTAVGQHTDSCSG